MSAHLFLGPKTRGSPRSSFRDAPVPRVSRWVRDIIDHPDDLILGHALGRDPDADLALLALACAMRIEGLHVEGFVQLRGAKKGDCNCREMHLVDLANDDRVRISEDRGTGAQGCHLDWAALTDIATYLERRIGPRTDFLIINRFGRAEAEGAGMRGVISSALDQGVRVIVGYRPDFAEAWAAFHAGLARNISV